MESVRRLLCRVAGKHVQSWDHSCQALGIRPKGDGILDESIKI